MRVGLMIFFVPRCSILLRVSILVTCKGVFSLKLSAKKWVSWVRGLIRRRRRFIHCGQLATFAHVYNKYAHIFITGKKS